MGSDEHLTCLFSSCASHVTPFALCRCSVAVCSTTSLCCMWVLPPFCTLCFCYLCVSNEPCALAPLCAHPLLLVAALLCLKNAKSGGLSSWSSSMTVHNEILKRRPDLAPVMAAPWYMDRKGEVPEGKQPYFQIPIFNYFMVSHPPSMPVWLLEFLKNPLWRSLSPKACTKPPQSACMCPRDLTQGWPTLHAVSASATMNFPSRSLHCSHVCNKHL